MGCCSSSKPASLPTNVINQLAAETRFSHEQVRSLYRRFRNLDADGDLVLTAKDFQDVVALQSSPFSASAKRTLAAQTDEPW